MNTTSPVDSERRVNPHIREIFEQACRVLAPIVKANDPVKTISSFAMVLIMQERFPELSQSDIQVVIMTVEKVHKEERLHLILNKQG